MSKAQFIGQLTFVITWAAALAYFLSLYLLWLYLRAVRRSKVLRLFQINSSHGPPALPLISELCASAVLPPGITPNETTAILVGVTGSLKDHRFFVQEEIFRIGASTDNDLIIKNDAYVSGNHANLRYRQGALSIVDQHSKNGTFVNDKRLQDAPLIVKAGDKIRLGKSIVEVVWVKRDYEKVKESRRA